MKRLLFISLAASLFATTTISQDAPAKRPAKAGAKRAAAAGLVSGFVTTKDNLRIHYLEMNRDREDSSKPALLFIPGWTMPAEIWEPQIRHFGKTHRVVAMDPRGQGRSSKPRDGYFPASRARDIKAVVDHLKLAQVVLIGWSMGVTEVAAYVDQFGTADLAAMVFVDGSVGGEFDPKITPLLLNFAARQLKDRDQATEAFVRGMFKNPDVQKDAKYLARLKAAVLRTPTDAAMAAFLGSITTDNRPALGKIDKPALMVTVPGTAFDAGYDEMAKRIAGVRHEKFEGAGHALFVDQAEKFNALLDEFLASFATRERLR